MDNLQQPSVLAMPFANNGDKNVIPSAPTGTNKASLSEGFPQITSESIAEGGIPPERADMNALGNIATIFYYFMQCGGAYTFRADVSSSIGGYPKSALLWYIPATGIPNLLTSTINNNTNNFNTDPSVIGEAGSGKPWEIVTVSPTNFMDLISNQTAAGNKTFTGNTTFNNNTTIVSNNPQYKAKDTAITKGTNPSSTKGMFYCQNCDSNGNTLGGVYNRVDTNGNCYTALVAYDFDGSSNAQIGVHYDADGKTYATCPTPPAGDSSNKTATTEWITNFATGYPDYANRVSKDFDTNYTATEDGLLYIFAREGGTGNKVRYITINNVQFPYIQHTGDGVSSNVAEFFLKTGDTYNVGKPDTTTNSVIYFIPYRQ